jgi:hypothetical protein
MPARDNLTPSRSRRREQRDEQGGTQRGGGQGVPMLVAPEFQRSWGRDWRSSRRAGEAGGVDAMEDLFRLTKGS